MTLATLKDGTKYILVNEMGTSFLGTRRGMFRTTDFPKSDVFKGGALGW